VGGDVSRPICGHLGRHHDVGRVAAGVHHARLCVQNAPPSPSHGTQHGGGVPCVRPRRRGPQLVVVDNGAGGLRLAAEPPLGSPSGPTSLSPGVADAAAGPSRAYRVCGVCDVGGMFFPRGLLHRLAVAVGLRFFRAFPVRIALHALVFV
jgi:hypothetical protein